MFFAVRKLKILKKQYEVSTGKNWSVRNKDFEIHSATLSAESDLLMITEICSNNVDDNFVVDQSVPSIPSLYSRRQKHYRSRRVLPVSRQNSKPIVLHFNCNIDYEKVVCSLHFLVFSLIAFTCNKPPARQLKSFWRRWDLFSIPFLLKPFYVNVISKSMWKKEPRTDRFLQRSVWFGKPPVCRPCYTYWRQNFQFKYSSGAFGYICHWCRLLR